MHVDEIDVYNLDDLGYVDDAFGAYLRYIKNFQPLPKDEIYALGIRSMHGDKEAEEKLILHHLAFVVYIAKPYFKIYSHVDPMDIVQYGNEGLMKAISMYDPAHGALTTYAGNWIEQRIVRNLDDNYQELDTPVHILEATRKYKKILNRCERDGTEIPKDKELMELLDVTKDALELVKENYNRRFVSMNSPIGDDGDEFGEFIEEKEAKRPEDVVSTIDEFDSLIAIKKRIRPLLYYVFYMRNLDKETHTLDELADELNVTRERVRQLENDAREKIKILFGHDGRKIGTILRELKESEKSNFYKLDEKPIQPMEIIKYLYLVKFFNVINKDILRDIYIHPYKLSIKEAANKYSMTESEFKKRVLSIKGRVNEILETKEEDFKRFKEELLSTYQTKIYDIDLGTSSAIDYQDLIKRYSPLSLKDIRDTFGGYIDKLSKSSKSLIQRYFSLPNYKIVDNGFVEREVNLALFNYTDNDTKLSPKVLLPTYNKYKDRFNPEQQLILECFFFHTKDKSLYSKDKHTSQRSVTLNYSLLRLEKYHYGLNTIWYQSLTKEMYEEVLKNYGDLISEERKNLLNLYFGVGVNKKSIQEIADMYNTDYIKIHDSLKHARDYVFNLYANRQSKKIIDKSIYAKYITDVAYELTRETRRILHMHVLDGYSYDVISKKTGLTKYRISNIITDGIRKIDFYRFGITKATIIDETIIDLILANNKKNFNEVDARIVKLRFVSHLNNDAILKILSDNTNINNKILGDLTKVNRTYINRVTSRFITAYESFVVSTVEPTIVEIKEYIDKDQIESTLTENEKKVLSLTLGIKNSYNKLGKLYSNDEILKLMDITVNQFFHFKNGGMKKVKLTKVGLLEPTDIYMPISELERTLADKHLPISDKERNIIECFCGFNKKPQMSFKEIAEYYGENVDSIRRRYQRAIVNIKKYLNYEIEGKIDFDTDIKPSLKYFNKTDRIYIVEYYKNGLSYEAIAKKYNVTFDKVVSIYDGISMRINDILEHPSEPRFDYEYAESVLDKCDLPFFGNRNIAKDLYMQIFGGLSMEKVPVTDAIKNLNLDITSHAANTLLFDFMISICKYRDGIKQNLLFGYDEIKDYFDRNKDSITGNKLITYNVYFNRYENNTSSLLSTYVNDTIKYDLLRDKEKKYFKVSTTSRDKVLNILKNRKYKLNKDVRHSLMQTFNISERELMSGQEINHVMRLLHFLELNKKQTNSLNLIDEKKLEIDI